MLITLNFHPTLYKFTGGVKQHNIEVAKLKDIKDALVVLFPKMRRYVHLIMNNSLGKENLCLVKPDGTPVTRKEFEFNLVQDDEYTLCPVVAGGGRKILPILMIIAANIPLNEYHLRFTPSSCNLQIPTDIIIIILIEARDFKKIPVTDMVFGEVFLPSKK